jgi:DNA-binding MarR family transcriptional regulator
MDVNELIKLTRLRNRFAKITNEQVNLEYDLPKAVTLESQLGITSKQASIVVLIYHCGPHRINELAAYTMSESANVTRVVNNLVERGLVKKNKKSGEKAVYIELTEKGSSAVFENLKFVAEIDVKRYNRYLSEPEQNELFTLYSRLIEILSQLGKV